MSDESRLAQILDQYLAQLRAGSAPAPAELMQEHPDLAADLEDCLGCLDLVERGFAEDDADSRAELLGGILGDFRIIREVGRGGMGVVYEAEQISLGRRVALKVLPFAAVFDERHLERFRNEAQAAAFLHHTHIVPVHAVGHERGVHYYAMQYIEGRSLAQIVEELRRGPVEPSQPLSVITQGSHTRSVEYCRAVARLGIQAAGALAHAHERGVVHRDVKPANLMVDALGHLWVTDFGLASFERNVGLTLTGDLLGTVRYMSPEQARRLPVDPRTDVYSLGVTLYELLALEPAFPGKDPQAVMQAVAFDDPVPLRKHNPAVPADLETILLKATTKDPGDRYHTASDFAGDLERFLNHEAVQAKRPSMLDRAGKWARRHRAAVTATLVALVVAVAALTVATVVATQRTREAEAALDRVRRSFDLADRAVDRMLSEVGARELASIPGMASRRERLLNNALSFYEELLSEQTGDEDLLADVARAHRNIGVIHGLLGRVDEAVASFDRAQEMFDGLGLRRERLAVNREEGDLLLRIGKLREAAALHDRLLADWWASAPDGRARDVAIAGLLIRRGVIRDRLGDHDAARADFEAARDLYADHATDADAGAVEGLAVASLNLGEQLLDCGPLADAEHALREAVRHAGRLDLPGLQACATRKLAQYLADVGRVEEAAARQEELVALRREQGPGAEGDLVTDLTRSGTLSSQSHPDAAEADLAEAIRRAERLVAAFPRFPRYKRDLAEAHTRLAMHYEDPRFPDAMPHYREALRLNEELAADFPDDAHYRGALAKALSNMAGVYERAGERDEGVAALRRGLELHEELVRQHPDSRDYKESLAANWNNLTKVVPEAETATVIRKAIELYEELRRDFPEILAYTRDQVWIHWNLAQSMGRAGRPADAEAASSRAVDLVEELVERHSGNAEVHAARVGSLLRLGFCRRQLGLPGANDALRKTIDAAKALVDVAPTPMHHWEHARALDLLADGLEGDAARAAYQQAIEILRPFGDRPEHHIPEQLGNSLWKLGVRFEGGESMDFQREAIQWSRRTLHVKYDHRMRLAARLREYADKLAASDPEGAEAAYRESLGHWRRLVALNARFALDLGVAHIHLGVLLMNMGRTGDAREQWEQAEAVLAGSNAGADALVVVLSNLATLHTREGRIADAIAAYERGLAVRPGNGGLNNGLAWLLATAADTRLRDAEAAVRHARAAVSKKPKNKGFQNTLGAALLRAGKPEEAVGILEKSAGPQRDYAGYLLALAYTDLGESDAARRWFDDAEAARQERKTTKADLSRLRDEAAAALSASR